MSVKLIVIREDARAHALLSDVARRLAIAPLVADEHAHVVISLEAGADGEWRRVRDALDAAGDDWWAYFHLPRPDNG